MKLRKIVAATTTVLAAVLSVCSPAHASLVLLGAQDFQGTGLGAVNTILTIQSPANSSTETGSVGRTFGTATDVITGNAKTGASQTQTRSISSLGVTSATDLRVVFNALEPGNGANSILLSDLMLSIFRPNGELLFSSGEFSAVNFPDTFTGAGNSGFVFGLDATQAAQVLATTSSAWQRLPTMQRVVLKPSSWQAARQEVAVALAATLCQNRRRSGWSAWRCSARSQRVDASSELNP